MRKAQAKHLALYLILCLVTALFFSCAKTSFQTRKGQHGKSEELNYEYNNRYYKKELRKRHFTLNIEVDKPALIAFGDAVFNNVHAAALVRGTAVVKVRVNSSGSVLDYSILKRAGVGLDDYIPALLKGATFMPVEHRESYEETDFLVKVVFKD